MKRLPSLISLQRQDTSGQYQTLMLNEERLLVWWYQLQQVFNLFGQLMANAGLHHHMDQRAVCDTLFSDRQ